MADKLTIYNKALSHCKIGNITSVNQQCEAARKCNLFYDCNRQSLLRACDWKFAKKKKALVLLGSIEEALLYPTDLSKQDVLPQWAYTYAYPVQCQRVHKLFNTQNAVNITPWNDRSFADHSDRQVLWEEARSPRTDVICIGTNIPEAWAQFTADIDDETQFDSMFEDALAWGLASDIAMPLSCDKELCQLVKQEAARQEAEAKRINGGEGPEMSPRGSNYEQARAGYDRD